MLDAASGFCLGCGRTLAEIAGWVSLSYSERLVIMDLLPARLAGLKMKAPIR